MKIDFKKITDDIVSRPSTYLICTYGILSLRYGVVYPLDSIAMWKFALGNHGYTINEFHFIYASITTFLSIILLSIILIESLAELKLKHKIVQNWFVKIIVLPIFLYSVLLLIIPSVFVILVILIMLLFGW